MHAEPHQFGGGGASALARMHNGNAHLSLTLTLPTRHACRKCLKPNPYPTHMTCMQSRINFVEAVRALRRKKLMEALTTGGELLEKVRPFQGDIIKASHSDMEQE